MTMQARSIGRKRLLRAGALTLVLTFAVFSSPAQAQTKASVAPPPINPFAPGVIINFKEHMRTFVENISANARTIRPAFLVLAKDGLALVDKQDPEDDTLSFPARTYIRALDGVLETNLLNETVTTPDGKPMPELEAALKRRKTHEATAATFGLKIFNLEFSTAPADVDKLYNRSAQKGYVPFVAANPALATVPKDPAQAFRVNPRSINAAEEVRNYLMIENSQAFGTTQDYIQTLRNTNYDLLIIDVFHKNKPLTRQNVEFLKYKKLGGKRLVLAQMDISSAATFRYYWQPGWGKGRPSFVWTPFRRDPDRYRTIYWDPAWQTIIAGNVKSYLYGIIDLGFDGVVLTGVDGWKYFESGGEQG